MSRSASPLLAAAIVNHSQDEEVRAQLEAYRKADPARFSSTEWIVISNGAGRDRASSTIAMEPPTANVEFITSENDGYGSAINLALRHSTAPYLLALNADLLPEPGFLESVHGLANELAAQSTAPDRIGVVGLRLLDADGRPQGSAGVFPTLGRVLLGLLRPRSKRKYLSTSGDDAIDVPWVTGACCLLDRNCTDDLVGFDEQFFMYYEDVDLCLRAAAAGWRVRFDPRAAIRHLFPYHSRPLTHEMVAMARLSMLLYFWKHRPRWELAVLEWIALIECRIRGWRTDPDARARWRSLARNIRNLVEKLKREDPAVTSNPNVAEAVVEAHAEFNTK